MIYDEHRRLESYKQYYKHHHSYGDEMAGKWHILVKAKDILIYKNYDEEDQLKHMLEDFSIDEIKIILESAIKIYDTRNLKKIVALIVRNQPHDTVNFAEYDKYNADITYWNFLVPKRSDEIIGLLAFFPILFFAPLFLTNLLTDDSNLSAIVAVSAVVLVPLSINSIQYRYENCRHNVLYPSQNSIKESVVDETEHDDSLTDLESAKKDYKKALSRISSYETDISKAIAYPAFNDLSVPEVSAMIKQLRKCERLFKESKLSAKVDTISTSFVCNVDTLWVDIQTAERVAKKIAWSNVSIKEKKDLKLAQDLMRHAVDVANTDTMRANYYQKLKVVIDRLNADYNVIPVKVVAEIESEYRLLLTDGSNVQQELGDDMNVETALQYTTK